MNPHRQAILEFARTNQLVCTEGQSPDKPSVRLHDFRARGNCCLMSVRVSVDDSDRRIDITVSGSPKVPRVRMVQATRLLELADSGDTFGKFMVDDGTSAVVYTTSASAADIDLDAEAIAFAVGIAGIRFDRLYPALVEVINTDADPDELWPLVESPDWERINQEYNALACRPAWGPPGDRPALSGVLRLPA